MILDKVFYGLEKEEHLIDRCTMINAYNNMEPLTLKKILSDYITIKEKNPPYSCGVINEFVYDVDRAIKNCGLTAKQYERLMLWIVGFNEREISIYSFPNCSRWVISKSLVVACEKILIYLREC